ncbi:hypothetical protein D187_000356 [Cystobacter fuscus DSM 2262]|uniref:Uncharacterized protein n=1 Tax=Cystobacter fuscus (strain ATCC 25194 / DSM 2262 / NBRC 100088 / M29) TaxID=1242864 RepID=S9R7A7_CYSF2|nr:hypothetical protein [Cystobacter fuscus]EPX64933.1 hypothetical protein D187_000356 [Cystobacter fuscus DSM 2262]
MAQTIHPGNLHLIDSTGLREAAAQALASGRAVRRYVCPAVVEIDGFVETLVVGGNRAAQASDVDPVVRWGLWDAGSQTLRLADGALVLGLRGECVATTRVEQAPVAAVQEERRDALSARVSTEDEVRALVARSRDLLELFFTLRQNFALVASLSVEQRRRLLPTFGDSEPPWNMEGVWSWSTSQVIVHLGEGLDGLQLVGRQHWDH